MALMLEYKKLISIISLFIFHPPALITKCMNSYLIIWLHLKRLFKCTWIATWIPILLLNTDFGSHYCLVAPSCTHNCADTDSAVRPGSVSEHSPSGSTWWRCGCMLVGSVAQTLLRHWFFFCFISDKNCHIPGFVIPKIWMLGKWWKMKGYWCYTWIVW